MAETPKIADDATKSRQEIGRRIRQLENRFKNRAEAAAAIGVAKSTLQAWGEGRSDPSFGGLARLAEVTGVSLDWIAFGVGDTAARGPDGQRPSEESFASRRVVARGATDVTWAQRSSILRASEYILSTVYDLGLELSPRKLAEMIADRSVVETERSAEAAESNPMSTAG